MYPRIPTLIYTLVHIFIDDRIIAFNLSKESLVTDSKISNSCL